MNEEQRQRAHKRLTEITKSFRPSYIEGILEAEERRWNRANDNLPSFDYLAPEHNKAYQALVRALFAMSLPLTFAAETGTSGLWVVGAGAAGAAGSAVPHTNQGNLHRIPSACHQFHCPTDAGKDP